MNCQSVISESLETYLKITQETMNSTQNFISVLKVIFQLEESYSKSLEKIGQQISSLINEKDGTMDLFIILRSYLFIKSEQANCFAMQLKNTLIQEQQEFFIKQDNLKKKLHQFSLANKKEYQQNSYTLNFLIKQYKTSIEEEKQYQINRFHKKQSSYAVSELSFQNFITIYNQFVDACSNEILNFQEQLKIQELERKNLLQDTHLKFIMFEISVIRNLQYDLTGISQKLEQYKSNNVLEQLFNKNINLEKIDFETYKRNIYLQLNFKPDTQLLSKVKKPIFDQVKSKDQENNELFSEESLCYLKMFQNVLLYNNITDDLIQRLSELLEVALPYSYTQCLEQVLQKLISEKNQKQDLQHYQVSHENYLSVQKLLITLLDHCDKYQDYPTAILEACLLAKKIFKRVYLPTENKEINLSVFEGLMNHQVIQNSQIWIDYAINLQKSTSNNNCLSQENYMKNCQFQFQESKYIDVLQQIGCNKKIIKNIEIIFNTKNLNGQNQVQ
ncbi:unnamed protein product [Paramecium sonneborni]|uniref:Uncharacterized protein n=1 Tax=Paramecium sonneborni TaxID=65129 RepID=A0A8S1Q4G0_9CILI|nr:unnamed protein product [Paramecium sonneborni]